MSSEADWEIVDHDRVSHDDQVEHEKGTLRKEPLEQWTTQIKFWLNGKMQIIRNPSPSLLLADWLREKKGLTGTKIGCGEGGCGICTVAMSFEGSSGRIETVSINSCLRRVCALDGVHIITTEGLGGQGAGFHPVQKTIADGNGSQCGFCTPGWVMNMYALLQKKDTDPTKEEIEQHFDGNLCRCTGYRPILTSLGEFAKGGKCAGKHNCVSHPAEMLGRTLEPLHFSDPSTGNEWYRPLTLTQLADIRNNHSAKKDIRLLCANTSAGVLKYLSSENSTRPIVFIDITKLPDLAGSIFDDRKGITFGANVPIGEVIDSLEKHSNDAQFFTAIAAHLKRVASVQIRNVGSWAGNIMLTRERPSFSSDLVLVLSTAAAKITILDAQGTTQIVTIPELLGMKGDITVVSMNIPLLPPSSIFRTYKTAQRHVFAHAIVNLGAYFAFEGQKVLEARVLVGGATETLCVASKTASTIVGRVLDHATFLLAAKTLAEEINTNPSSDERHTSEYRLGLAHSFLFKAFLAKSSSLPPELHSTQESYFPADARPISSGTESFGVVPTQAPIGEYIPKLKSRKQASGEATFTSDFAKGHLFAQIVFSTKAKAKLIGLDPEPALSMPGVVDFVSASDVPGVNCVDSVDGPGNLVEKAFFEVGDLIPCVGSVLGVIVAESWAQAREAAKLVVQRYSSQGRVVTTFDEAERLGRMPTQKDIEDASATLENEAHCKQKRIRPQFTKPFSAPWTLEDTTPKAEATQTLKGVVNMGWQYHFYMETQSVLVSPVDGDCFEVVASTQWQQLTQNNIAAILKVPANNINVKTYQIGGAFGGKIARNLILTQACAVAAHKLKTSVFAQNERSDDMQMFTGRDGISYRYTVNYDPSGKVDTMDGTMLFGPGYFLGDAAAEAAMGVQWADDCFYYRKFKLDTKTLLTDVAHTGSCRSPGAMNASVFAQVVMEHVAKSVGKSTEEVQEMNFYKVGDKTPFGDEIGKYGFNFTVPLMWKKLQADTDYLARKRAIEEYNTKNRWTKKGLALSTVKYIAELYAGGNGYHMGVIVDVYKDGSVLISHGGIEMGQGINTKAILVAANALKIPVEKIRVGPAESSKTPNAFVTGGSGTSETVCAGVIKACEVLNDRLKPYVIDKKLSWEDAAAAALGENVNLMVSSWQVWEKDKKDANEHPYATYGVCASEVLVDVLTGEIRVEKVDILMDLGTQLDAAIDIGQLQGGFVMAMGWLLSEELRWNANGTQLNLGTWEYKIPTAYDIPVEFNVSLLKDVPNQSPTAVKGSKLQSEPAMALVSSILLAVKQALYAARKDNGLGEEWFQLDTPLTPETMRRQSGSSVDKFVVPKA